MDCAVCTHLTTECSRLKSSYGIAVDRLFTFGYSVADEDYEQLKSAVRNCRIDLELARCKVAKHEKIAHRRNVYLMLELRSLS